VKANRSRSEPSQRRPTVQRNKADSGDKKGNVNEEMAAHDHVLNTKPQIPHAESGKGK
jgi:hypothetical protein